MEITDYIIGGIAATFGVILLGAGLIGTLLAYLLLKRNQKIELSELVVFWIISSIIGFVVLFGLGLVVGSTNMFSVAGMS